MITYATTGGRFLYRVAGVYVDEGHVLLQGNVDEEFWSLPGGRVELMEPAEAALRREMREELDWDDGMRIGRLLWIVENFFVSHGEPHHEIGLYFVMTPPAHARMTDKTATYPCHEPDSPLLFRWFALATTESAPLLPSFLPAALRDLPATPQHIVHYGE